MNHLIYLISKLEHTHALSSAEWIELLEGIENDSEASTFLTERARSLTLQRFGRRIFIRGLIEFTNYCKNDCYYCGIRCSNKQASRYRLNRSEILECCATGYDLGFRTFVLQGGEDYTYTDAQMSEIIASIHHQHPDCAITLSVGERSHSTYQQWFDAGANRFLLRHETADESHYRKLHPDILSLQHRMACLEDLKAIGYQTGTGFMVGSPFQTPATLAKDLLFIHKLQPQMVGIGPFIPHKDTPFRDAPAGSMQQTLHLLSMLRLMLPDALLPSTTALGTIDPFGREAGILAGANVVMPNLSPQIVRKKYTLYNNKICTNEEAAESIDLLKQRLDHIGYEIVIDRGDYIKK